MNKLLSPEEIAEYLNVKISTIYNWTHLGYIPHIKVGRLVRFNESEILRWLEERSVDGRKTRGIDVSQLGLKRQRSLHNRKTKQFC